MSKLLLIKHAAPSVFDGVTPSLWSLSEDGVAGAQRLAKALTKFNVRLLASSSEPKAHETASIVSVALGCGLQVHPGLAEHDRRNITRLDQPTEFHRRAKELFERPNDLVYGQETAKEALNRFQAAVEEVLGHHGDGDVAIVAHGTVITLLVAAHNQIDPFDFWRSLDLPSIAVLDVDTMKLLDTMTRID